MAILHAINWCESDHKHDVCTKDCLNLATQMMDNSIGANLTRALVDGKILPAIMVCSRCDSTRCGNQWHGCHVCGQKPYFGNAWVVKYCTEEMYEALDEFNNEYDFCFDLPEEQQIAVAQLHNNN